MRNKWSAFVLLLSLLQVVFCFHADFNKCPGKNGKFPKQGSSCKSYYNCKDWKAIERTCPQDQHFLPAIGDCVWPEEYPCLEKAKHKECPLLNGKFMKERTRCKVYYDCRKGIPTTKRCPGELLFDHTAGKCDWPELVNCPEGISTTGTVITQSTPVIITSTFRSTSTKKSTATSATRATPKWLTTKSKDKNSSEESGSSEEGSSSEEDKQSTTKYKTRATTPSFSTTPKQSTTKYKTRGTTPSLSTMPESSPNTEIGTEFVTGTVNEQSSTTYENTGTSTTESDTSFPTFSKSSPINENGSEGVITELVTDDISTKNGGSTDDCIENRFSYSEVIYDESSPTEPFQDINTDSTTVTSVITDTVTLHIFCPKLNGHFPHPNDRHKFIACVAGNPTVMDCPENLVYDHKRKSCEYE